jgi:hypothetical protein
MDIETSTLKRKFATACVEACTSVTMCCIKPSIQTECWTELPFRKKTTSILGVLSSMCDHEYPLPLSEKEIKDFQLMYNCWIPQQHQLECLSTYSSRNKVPVHTSDSDDSDVENVLLTDSSQENNCYSVSSQDINYQNLTGLRQVDDITDIVPGQIIVVQHQQGQYWLAVVVSEADVPTNRNLDSDDEIFVPPDSTSDSEAYYSGSCISEEKTDSIEDIPTTVDYELQVGDNC